MSEPKQEEILALLRRGIELLGRLTAERKLQLGSLVRDEVAAIERDVCDQEELLEQFSAWQQKLRNALPQIPLSRFCGQLKGADRSEFQSTLVQLQAAILSNRSRTLPLYRYLQTSLCFTRGLLESVREDCPGYDRAGHLRSSDFESKQVVFDL